jgi:leader peptidase (prepilin peptidase) / N-methyltransferase
VSSESLTARAAPASAGHALPGKPQVLVPVVVGVVVLAFACMPVGRACVSAFTAAVLVVLAAIDVERGIIPNRIVLPAAAVVLVANIVIDPSRASEWVLAAVISCVVLSLPALFGRNWMGMGDAKLALLIGAALGWGVVGALLLGLLCSFPAALYVVGRGGVSARKTTIPFGPFLVAGALIVMFVPHLVS